MRLVLVNCRRGEPDVVAHAVMRSAGKDKSPWLVDWLAVEVRERCHAAYKIIDGRDGMPATYPAFAGQLDVPLDLFGGLSPRNAYQRFESSWLASAFPEDQLGRWAADRMKAWIEDQQRRCAPKPTQSIMVPDCAGRGPSAQRVVDAFPGDVTLLQVYAKGDSRYPLELTGVRDCVVEIAEDFTPSQNEAAFRKAAPHLFLELPPSQGAIVVAQA